MVTETRDIETELPPNEAPPAPAPLSPFEPTESVPARRGPRGLMLALLLIGFGIALLLNNLGIITVDWVSLWRFWPVLLILVGLEVMLGHRSFLGSLSIVLLGVAVVSGVIFFSGAANRGVPFGDITTREFSQEVGDVESLTVDLNLGAGNTTVTALAGDTIQATYTSAENSGLPIEYDVRGSVGYLTTSSEPGWFGMTGINDLTLNLPSGVPLDLNIDRGAGNITLDLTSIQLSLLDIDSGLGNLTINLPDQGDYPVTIDGGAGNVNITLPQGLAASVDADSGLGNLNFGAGLTQVDDSHWQTSDFNSAVNRVEITIDSGVGNVTIDN